MISESNDEELSLEITIAKERFYNDETNYGVYICYPTENDNSNSSKNYITVVGLTFKLTIGNKYNATLVKTSHPRYGVQYKIESITSSKPATKKEEQSFLKNLVTRRQFDEIIKVYQKPITVIMNGTFDITKVKYIGEKILKVIQRKVKENIHMLTISAEIGKYGLDFKQIMRIAKHFKNAEIALQKIKSNPYILYHEISGFGFLKTDEIAQRMGIVADDPRRIQAALLYSLEQEETGGNTYGYVEDIRDKTESLIGIKIQDINQYIQSDLFYADGLRLARKHMWDCENTIAQELLRIDSFNNIFFDFKNISKNIINIENNLNIKYDDNQKQLFYEINNNNVVVFTGFAGTGKSSTLGGLLDMLDEENKKYILMSPTARAAKRMEEATGRKASTIHRALGLTGGFDDDIKTSLDADIVVIDEISMVDIFLFSNILKAIPNNCKLLCVGDYAQLESISAGNVLYDMINSNKITCIKLNKVFRQENGSKLLDVITDIREGKIFFNINQSVLELGKDCKLWFGTKELTAPRIELLYKNCLSKYDKKDIMVISPTKNGGSGIKELNERLQEVANPYSDSKKEIKLLKCTFREGDMVMHTKNNYHAVSLDDNNNEIEGFVFNGDMGTIVRIEHDESLEVYVDYYDRIIKYKMEDLNDLDLAYAITVHKSQGSESKVVIMALDTSHYKMLKRSLIYTGASRASTMLFIVGDPRALRMAINNNQITEKRTFLKEDIKSMF